MCHQLNSEQFCTANSLNSSLGVSFSVISAILGLQDRDGAGDGAGDCWWVFLRCLLDGGGDFFVVEDRLLAIVDIAVV